MDVALQSNKLLCRQLFFGPPLVHGLNKQKVGGSGGRKENQF